MTMHSSHRPLEGKVAVVVGGSGGIGREACRLFADAGAVVVVGYRSGKEKAEEIAAALAGEGHLALPVAIEETATIEAFRDAVVQKLGRADILVNTASKVYV